MDAHQWLVITTPVIVVLLTILNAAIWQSVLKRLEKSEALIQRMEVWANGVKSSFHSALEVVDDSCLAHGADSPTTPPSQVSMWKGTKPKVVGSIFVSSKKGTSKPRRKR